MNFLIRPDAEALLAANDYARMWPFFTKAKDGASAPAWLTDAVKDQYRAVWAAGLTGGCNYYRASPLRPPRPEDPGAAAVELPHSMLTVNVPTMVVWGLDDVALPPELIDGLDAYIPRLTLHRVEGASHWIVHEQPQRVARHLGDFLQTRS
jgi:pimeloyl-ACP methyl ester carboxylesterase